jgi:hypothetical protein
MPAAAGGAFALVAAGSYEQARALAVERGWGTGWRFIAGPADLHRTGSLAYEPVDRIEFFLCGDWWDRPSAGRLLEDIAALEARGARVTRLSDPPGTRCGQCLDGG